MTLLKGWLLSLLGWGLVGFAMAAHGVTTRDDAWSMHLEPSLRTWLPWAVFTPLLFRLVLRLPLDRQHWPRAVPVHLVVFTAVMLACQAWRDADLRWLGLETARGPGGPRGERFAGRPRGPRPPEGFGERRPPPPDFLPGDRPATLHDGSFREGARFPLNPPSRRGGPFNPPFGRFDMMRFMSFQLPLYLMILAGAHAALFFRREQERAALLAHARLDALRMQLQPHFLFNTLNTIAGLIHEEPDKADALLTALSELLRMSLETSGAQELPLRREMEFVERYLMLMHARFEERVRFEIDVEPGTRGALVPPMLLQPLVENAIEHGLQPKPGGGVIRVRAWQENQTLHLTVSDDGAMP